MLKLLDVFFALCWCWIGWISEAPPKKSESTEDLEALGAEKDLGLLAESESLMCGNQQSSLTEPRVKKVLDLV
jgi:DNA segregation ATPase FtsK/SpoIIIE-like protein